METTLRPDSQVPHGAPLHSGSTDSGFSAHRKGTQPTPRLVRVSGTQWALPHPQLPDHWPGIRSCTVEFQIGGLSHTTDTATKKRKGVSNRVLQWPFGWATPCSAVEEGKTSFLGEASGPDQRLASQCPRRSQTRPSQHDPKHR